MSERWIRALIREHWALAVILAILLGASISLNVASPRLERPDEIAFMADALDEIGAQDNPAYEELVDEFEDHQSSRQDKAYRALVRGITGLIIDPTRDDSMAYPNPYVRPYDPIGTANKNALIYPLHGGQLARAVHILRAVSLVFIVVAVIIVYIVSLWLLQDRFRASLAAMLAAFTPSTLIASASVNADGLTALAMCVLLAISVSLWKQPRRQSVTILLSVASGCLALISPALRFAAIIVPIVLAAQVHQSARTDRQAWRSLAASLLILGGLGAIGQRFVWPQQASWSWLTRLIAGVKTLDLLTVAERWFVGLCGLNGWRNILLDAVVYTALGALGIIGLGGVGLAFVRSRWHRHTQQSKTGLWLVITLASQALLRAIASVIQNHGLVVQTQLDFLFPAAIIFSVGLSQWLTTRRRWVWIGLLTIVLAGSAAPLYPWRTNVDASRSVSLDTLDSQEITSVGIEYGADLYLVGYRTDRDTVPRGETLTIDLVWLARKQPTSDYTVSVEVTGRQRMQVGISDTMPGAGRSPTSMWLPGQISIVQLQIPISEVAHTPTRGDLRVTVYRGAKEEALQAWAPDGSALGSSPRIGSIRLTQPTRVLYEPAVQLQADLGRTVRLFGLDLSPIDPVRGAEILIDLYWEARAPVAGDYTVFVHLVDAYGHIVAQTDEPPLQGDYPTTLWQAGEQILDRHAFMIPVDIGEGPYYLFIGMYNPETNERLTYTASDGSQADHLTLGPLFPRAR